MSLVPKKDKGGRRKGIPKKTIGFKVPVVVADQVKEDVRPHVEASVAARLADDTKTDTTPTK